MKNKEIEELLNRLKDKDWYEELDLTGTKWIELKQEETNLLLSYIEQLENNRDKAIERCEFWLDFYRNVNNDKRIILRLNDILSKLKGDSDE